MKQIDKNDVNISKLFSWGSEFKVATPRGDKTFWMKVIGDADLNRARVYGLRQSAILRKKLKTEGSDERLALIPDFDVTDKEKIVEVILLYAVTDLTDRAQKKLDLTYPKEPDSEADLAEHEKFQEELDKWPAHVESELKKAYNKEVTVEKKRLNKLSVEKLLEEYEETLINKLCENEFMRGFQEMCVFFASYTDDTYSKHLFDDVEEFQNLPTEVKEKFYVFYTTLNIPTEELKK
jgi:hypothetical protein